MPASKPLIPQVWQLRTICVQRSKETIEVQIDQIEDRWISKESRE